jgi:hypothetical protein
VSRKVAANRATRQRKSINKICSVFTKNSVEKLSLDEIVKKTGLHKDTVEDALERSVSEGLIGKIRSNSFQNKESYFDVFVAINNRANIEEEYASSYRDAYPIINGSDRTLLDASQRRIEDLSSNIPTQIEDIDDIEEYPKINGAYFSAIFEAKDEINEAEMRAYRDHLETEGEPKCSNCKYARRNKVVQSRGNNKDDPTAHNSHEPEEVTMVQCTLIWNDRSNPNARKYWPLDHKCGNFEWK